MLVLIPGVGILQVDRNVHVLIDREKHEEVLTRVTKFDKTQQDDKQHMCKVFSWYMTYGSGRTCLSLRNLPF